MGSRFSLSVIIMNYLEFVFMLDSWADTELQVQNIPEELRILFIFCNL